MNVELNDFQKKQKANQMEPAFKKLKVGDRGIFDETGKEFFVAKKLSKMSVGAYKDRVYILPVEYVDDIKSGMDKEAGFQITAFHFANMFEFKPDSLENKIAEANRLKDDAVGRSKAKGENFRQL